ncbi:hypothetical protein RQP46_007837 [Phenoliferia psychrophenolica]
MARAPVSSRIPTTAPLVSPLKGRRIEKRSPPLPLPLESPLERVTSDKRSSGRDQADISRVHLTLSPATLRRAQNCAKYLSLRYTPIFASLNSSTPLPNLLDVARFRSAREDSERLARRSKPGPSGRPRPYGASRDDIDVTGPSPRSEAGSSVNGRLDPAVAGLPPSTFGPRRNQHPKAWEVYPDDLTDYTAEERHLRPSPTAERTRSVSYEYPSPLRPPRSRENSEYGNSPLGRTSRASLDLPLSSGSPHGALRRAGSLGSSAPPSARSNFASLSTTNSQLQDAVSGPTGGGGGVGGSAGLQRAFALGASRTSIDEPNPSPPHISHRHSQSDGLRGQVGKAINRIRGKGGTDVESSEGLHHRRRRNDSATDLAQSPEPSDGDAVYLGASPPRPLLRSRRSPNPAFASEADHKSSGEEGGRGGFNKLFAGIGKKNGANRGATTATDRDDSMRPPLLGSDRRSAPVVLRRHFGEEDSEDEDPLPRETLDLPDEDFLRLNSALRQLRQHLAHVDVVLPRVPGQLNQYISEMTRHELETLNAVGISVEYTFPRFTASVVSKLAYDKQVAAALAYDSPLSSSPSSSSSDDDDDDEDVPRPLHRQHSRRVTDPVKGPPQVRMRSQTVAGPDRRLAHPSGREVDPLTLLEKAIEDLNRTTKDIDEAAERVGRNQDRVGKEIREVVCEVDGVEKAIEETYLQQLRMLDDHYFRLRTSLTRPSTSIDLFWAALSYFLTALFWFSWFLVTLFRILRSIVSFPIVVIRWLFFLR